MTNYARADRFRCKRSKKLSLRSEIPGLRSLLSAGIPAHIDTESRSQTSEVGSEDLVELLAQRWRYFDRAAEGTIRGHPLLESGVET